MDTSDHENATMATDIQNISKYNDDEKEAGGYCSERDNTGQNYNKLAVDVEYMVNDIQMLKENQEYLSLEDKDNMLINISPNEDFLKFNFASNDKKNAMGNRIVLATALDRLAKLDADEYARETEDHHNFAEKKADVTKDDDGCSRALPNIDTKDTNVVHSTTSGSDFLIILLVLMVVIVCIVTNLTPRMCSRSIAHQIGPHLPFLQVSWSDGIPPV